MTDFRAAGRRCGTPGAPGSQHGAATGLRVSRGSRGSRRLGAGLAVGLSLALGAGTVAPTASATDPDTRRSRLQRAIATSSAALADLSADAKRAVLALQATQRAIVVAQAALRAAQVRVAQAAAQKLMLDQRLTAAKADEARATAELARIRADIEQGEGRRNDMARLAYEGGGQGHLEVLLAGGSAIEISERLYLLEKANDAQNAELDDLAVARQQAAATLLRLSEARRRVAALTAEAQANLIEADQAQQARAAASQHLAQLAAEQRQQAAAVQARRASEARRLDALQAESDRLTAVLRHRRTGGVSRRWLRGNGRLSYPVNGPVTSPFGMRFHPILHYSRLHAGMDFGVGCGTPVYAAGDGEIVRAGWAGGYGNQVVIGHGGSLATTYNHLSAISKHSGSVGRGSLIGYVGTTGLSTGCHLHFEVRLNGTPVNPARYL